MKKFLKYLFRISFLFFLALLISCFYEWHRFATLNNKKISNNTPIPIVFAGDDGYITPLSVAITSISINAKTPTKIFILTNGFNQKNQEILKKLDEKLKHTEIKIVTVNPSYFNEFPVNKRWSSVIYYRYIIPKLFPEYKRIIYLDGDVLVLDDLQQLYNTHLNGNALAGVNDAFIDKFLTKPLFKDTSTYINSGILLIDTEKFSHYVDTLFQTTNIYKNEFTHYDQDAINLVFKNKITVLPIKYNAQQRLTTPVFKTIYHYSGEKKPWKTFDFSFYEWYKYFYYTQNILSDQDFSIKKHLNYLLFKNVYYLLFIIQKIFN